MSWKILEKENIKFDIIDMERKKILLYNKSGNSQRIILKDSGYIGNLNCCKNLNKKTQYNLFSKHNIKHPKSFYIKNTCDIDNIKIQFPAVMKPINGGRGSNIFFVSDKEQFLSKINKYSEKFILQERVFGDEYRILIYKNTIISICKKNHSILVGDGVNNLEVLIDNFNKFSKKHKFKIINKNILSGYNLKKIRKKGEIINLTKNRVMNGTRWTTQDTEHVHEDNIQLFINSLKALDYLYGGIDFIIPDISKSYKEQHCGILEINSDPSMEIMDSANKISDYNSCNNEYGKLFFDIIKIWYNE